MIVCTMPGCQTTAGCQCLNRNLYGRPPETETSPNAAAWPRVLGPSQMDVERVFAAGRLAGLREAAALVAKDAAIEEELARCHTGTDAAYEYAAAAGALNDTHNAILALAGREG